MGVKIVSTLFDLMRKQKARAATVVFLWALTDAKSHVPQHSTTNTTRRSIPAQEAKWWNEYSHASLPGYPSTPV